MLLEEAKTVPLAYPNIAPIHREPRIKKSWRKKSGATVDMDLQNSCFLPDVSFLKTDKDSITYDVSIWTDGPMNSSNAASALISQVTRRLRQDGAREAPVLSE